MRSYLRHPLTLLWLVLLLATVVSWWLGSDRDAADQASVLTTVAILAVAIVKCRLVIRNYMEVRYAPSWLRLTCDAWLLLNFGMVSCFYWFAV
jgi:cytochrome c oxidase subunit IV